MNRDELEAVVRQQITRVVSNALTAGVPSTGMMNRATDAILNAAKLYRCDQAAATDPQATRHRADLYAEVWGGNI